MTIPMMTTTMTKAICPWSMPPWRPKGPNLQASPCPPVSMLTGRTATAMIPPPGSLVPREMEMPRRDEGQLPAHHKEA